MCSALALLHCELESPGMLLETRISRTGSQSVFSTFGMGQMYLAEHVTRCLTRLFPGPPQSHNWQPRKIPDPTESMHENQSAR